MTLRLEGTVRGTGGLHLVDETCATSVEGLYAAGDAATRELICGGFTGGGSHNAAWAMSSGFWAGAGAADYARGQGSARASRRLYQAGTVALRDGASPVTFDSDAVIRAVQQEVFPTQRNWTRRADLLEDSLTRLAALWRHVSGARAAPGAREAVRAREAAAMLANSRWMYRSALQRKETRGMHRRREYTGADPAQRHRLLSGGLDEVWVERLYGQASMGVAA